MTKSLPFRVLVNKAGSIHLKGNDNINGEAQIT